MNIEADDVIQILTSQRNAALDEIVKMGAMIKALERRIKSLEQPSAPVGEPPDNL